jgi:hypothetical protein
MQDREESNLPERNDKLRNFLIVAAAYTVSALLYKLLFHEGLGHSSLLFIGLPGVLAILLALAPPAGTAKGGIVKGITFALLIIAPLVGEGYLCILMASPLFYAIGLAVGAAIDASRNKTTTLSCTAVIVIVLSLDGLVPVHTRHEVVSVTRVVPAPAEEVRAALAGPMNIAAPLPRFLRLGFPHIDHGYAVTSHSSQGQTAERVLIHADTELGAKDLLNHRMAYVSVSRGQWDAQIFTNDRDKLVQALSHDVSHKSALQPEQAISAVPQKIGPASEHVVERSMGYGLGL